MVGAPPVLQCGVIEAPAVYFCPTKTLCGARAANQYIPLPHPQTEQAHTLEVGESEACVG